MSAYLYIVFCENFHTIFAYSCVLLICIMDKTINKRNRFSLLLILTCAIIIFLNTKLCNYIAFMHRDDLYRVRFLGGTFGYIFEPLTSYILYWIICKPTGIKKYLSPLLVVINTVLFIQNFFTENVYTIIPKNIYVVTNPILICLPIVTAAFYFIILWVHLFSHRREISFYRFLGLGATTFAIILTTLIEKFTTLDILDTIIAISIILFYLMGYIEQSNKVITSQKETLANQRNALLLSQIQPHFIFNALNSIYCLCKNNNEEAARVLLTFSNYLHHTLDASLSRDLIPFSQELETTNLYTDLEKIRFEYIEINYFIEETNFLIPPLSIQPLVENSIRHGIRGKENGYVNIRSRKEKIADADYYVVTIEDNGGGIDKQKKSGANEKYHGTHSGIGMENVKNRIHSLVDGSFEVVSSDDGTVITITIPERNRFEQGS